MHIFISNLHLEDAPAYQNLVLTPFRHKLLELKSKNNIVAIGASSVNKAIGLAIAEIDYSKKTAQIFSLVVDVTYRNQGIGTAIISYLEKELKQKGCSNIQIIYVTGSPTTLALESLLKKVNWSGFTPRMLICKTNIEKFADAPWLKYTSLSDAYQTFPWSQVTVEEQAAFRRKQETNPWIPTDLYPFSQSQNFEPLNSLGLRYQGEIVGWIITHRFNLKTIVYTCGFVRQDLQKIGKSIPLFMRAFKIQIEANIPEIIWNTPLHHPAMIKMIKRRIAPYLNSLEESRICFKSIS